MVSEKEVEAAARAMCRLAKQAGFSGIVLEAMIDRDWRGHYADARAALEAASSVREEGAVSREPVWLVTSGPEAPASVLVYGEAQLQAAVVSAVFGDPNDTSEEAAAMRARCASRRDWEYTDRYPRWRLSWSFEDGYIHVQFVTPPVVVAPSREDGIREAAKAGWNACRRSIYAVCEDVQEKAAPLNPLAARTVEEKHHEEGYFRGQKSAAKSIARGFNSMEAEDDDNFQAAILALLPADNRNKP
jgi:hypothetical protein